MSRFRFLYRSCLVELAFLSIGASAQVVPQKRVLLLDGRQENKTCIAQTTLTCVSDPKQQFLEWTGGPELVVINRRFLTAYTTKVDGVTSIVAPGIRGLQEVAAIKLSPPVLLPGAKGPVAALAPHTTDEFFAQIVDESQVDKPIATIDADAAELERQSQALSTTYGSLNEQVVRLVTNRNGAGGCQAIGLVPLAVMLECLKAAVIAEQAADRKNEDQFRLLDRRAKDLIDAVAALGTALNQAAIPTMFASANADRVQFDQNVATFSANLTSLDRALALYEDLSRNGASTLLRRDQLRLQLRQKLKPPGEATAAIDEAELNALVDAYMRAVVGRSGTKSLVLDDLRARLKEAKRLRDSLVRALARTKNDSTSRRESLNQSKPDALPTVGEWNTLTRNVRIHLPAYVDSVNAAQAAMVTELNNIYDNSMVELPLVTRIALPANDDNIRAYYTIVRTDGYARYVVSPPANGATGAAPTATPSPTNPLPSRLADPAAAGTEVPVARGVVEVHHFDRANIVAAFAFSKVKHNTFSVTPIDPANKVGRIDSTSANGEHVILGLDYYFAPRDTYPGSPRNLLSMFGLFGGLALDASNNYFLGLTLEPHIGLNATVGWHWGRVQTLRAPFTVGASAATDLELTVEDKPKRDVFFAAGLDLQIFRKVFGVVTGIGGGTTTP